MTTAFNMSMKNAPTSGTTRNATWETPCRCVMAVMFAMAVGVAPRPKPMNPAADHGGVVVAAEHAEHHQHRERDDQDNLHANQHQQRAGEIGQCPELHAHE